MSDATLLSLRRFVYGNEFLAREVTEMLIHGDIERLQHFITSSPERGSALEDLYRKSGKQTFGDFIEAVLSGEYYWYGLGVIVGNVVRGAVRLGFETVRFGILTIRLTPLIVQGIILGNIPPSVTEDVDDEIEVGSVEEVVGEIIATLLIRGYDPDESSMSNSENELEASLEIFERPIYRNS